MSYYVINKKTNQYICLKTLFNLDDNTKINDGDFLVLKKLPPKATDITVDTMIFFAQQINEGEDASEDSDDSDNSSETSCYSNSADTKADDPDDEFIQKAINKNKYFSKK